MALMSLGFYRQGSKASRKTLRERRHNPERIILGKNSAQETEGSFARRAGRYHTLEPQAL